MTSLSPSPTWTTSHLSSSCTCPWSHPVLRRASCCRLPAFPAALQSSSAKPPFLRLKQQQQQHLRIHPTPSLKSLSSQSSKNGMESCPPYWMCSSEHFATRTLYLWTVHSDYAVTLLCEQRQHDPQLRVLTTGKKNRDTKLRYLYKALWARIENNTEKIAV